MKIHNLKIDKELIDLKIRGVKNWETIKSLAEANEDKIKVVKIVCKRR